MIYGIDADYLAGAVMGATAVVWLIAATATHVVRGN